MLHRTDDLRIEGLRPLLPPAILMEELPITEAISTTVTQGRHACVEILHDRDDRLLVVVGPCSIHDPVAGLAYARHLAAAAQAHSDDLLIAMRVYFEKPRTTVGWKGLINDPHLDNSFAINEGLRAARRFLLAVLDLGLPTGTEFLDPITPQFIADLVCWGAIGARTSESQVHRELASGLSMPVGFKNGTDGTVQTAIDAIGSSLHPHHFLSVTKQGVAAIVGTRGNPDCHVILRGGAAGPNYRAADIDEAVSALATSSLPGRLMVDCSHANSGKDHIRQPAVVADLAGQIASGQRQIFGVMLESFLLDGNQALRSDTELTYGQSVTDKCMSWERTAPLFDVLAQSVRDRRSATPVAVPGT
jgi:3-deoxy-7-phosphoheptulonate synthase|tara:strand:+ start:1821 stop:2903 length:1083 start_codon:yes stop_codon:yes gene_type:complete